MTARLAHLARCAILALCEIVQERVAPYHPMDVRPRPPAPTSAQWDTNPLERPSP